MMKQLLTSIQRGDLAEVKALLAAGAPVERSRWQRLWAKYEPSPLQAAVRGCSTAIAECLLDHGADPNAGTPTLLLPLPDACYWGDLPMMELLVARGAHVNAPPGSTQPSPIGVAATSKRMHVVDWLLKHGADPSAVFGSHVAIYRISGPILARLIDAGGKAPPDIEAAVRGGRW